MSESKMAINKRKHTESDSTKKRTRSDDTVGATNSTLNLIDLNDDVIVKIFTFLDDGDFLNVKKTCKQFSFNIIEAFKQKYRKEYLKLPLMESDRTSNKDLKRTDELLTYFGIYIGNLEFIFNKNNPIDIKIFDLIAAKCHETLVRLKIWLPSNKLKIQKRFTKLKTLQILHGSVDPSICQLHKWFPVLDDLSIQSVRNIRMHHLNVGRTSPGIKQTRQSVSSLKRFSLGFWSKNSDSLNGYTVDIDDLNKIIECNPLLAELQLTLDEFHILSRVSNKDRKSVHSPYSVVPVNMTVKLWIPSYQFDYVTPLTDLKAPTHRIENLELTIDRITNQIAKYISDCVNIKKLKIKIGESTPAEFVIPEGFTIECNSLTSLEVVARSSNIGLAIIRPFLAKCSGLVEVKVISGCGSGDTISSRIDRGCWSFAEEIYRNEQILYTLKKM